MTLSDSPLTEDESLEFQKALDNAFEPDAFDMMIGNRTHLKRTDLSLANTLPKRISDVITGFEQRGEIQILLQGAIAERPNNRLLRDFAQKFRRAIPTAVSSSSQAPENSLERNIRKLNSSLNVVQWRMRMTHLERQICRIMIQYGKKTISGTGFLLGPNVVMTNYHVVKEVINGDIPAEKVMVQFDYKLKEDGQTLDEGKICHLSEDWLVDSSENSELDLKMTDQFVDVEVGHLDYVLLRLEEKAGEEVVGEGALRGWIELPEKAPDFVEGSALFILHHPYGDPLQLTFDTQSVIGINTNKTRVRYATNTEEGSSGAPCFNADWELIAMHQSGDTDFHRSAIYNQGIPIETILSMLQKHGKKAFLGKKMSDVQPLESNFAITTQASTQQLQFDPPEEKMSKEIQLLLITLLEQSVSINLAQMQQQTEGKVQGSIMVSNEIIEGITKQISPEQTLSLVEGYMQVAFKEVEQVRQLFGFQGDIRLVQFTQTRSILEISEICLRRICILLNHVSHLPEMITSEKRLRICGKATKVIEQSEQLRQDIKEMQEKQPYDRKRREDIKGKCTGLLEVLEGLRLILEM